MERVPCYCEKCGGIFFLDLSPEEMADQVCYTCNEKTFKPIPIEYRGPVALKADLRDEFYEKVVKGSPAFDQSRWDRRMEIIKKADERIYAKMSAEKRQANLPRCPTCSSTNLRKVSTTSKVVDTALFGILGTKRHKTFHCNSCGYEW